MMLRGIYRIEGESNMIMTIEDRLKDHLPGRYEDTLKCYEMWEHQDWEDRDPDTGELIGFVSYFLLDFRFDMIITAAKENKFSKEQWRVLRETIVNRVKPLRIASDPSNKVLHRAVKKFGGKFIMDEIYFPEPGFRYE